MHCSVGRASGGRDHEAKRKRAEAQQQHGQVIDRR